MATDGPTLVCWKDGTDLTGLVRAQLVPDPHPSPVVLTVMADMRQDFVRINTRAKHPHAPLLFEFDPELLADRRLERHAVTTLRNALAEKRSMLDAEAPDESPAPPADWHVVVTCPTDACSNGFRSAAVRRAEALNEPQVAGEPLSTADDVWLEAAKEISPAKSLEHASDAAKFVIGNVSLVALIVGGFGIFSDIGGGFDQHPVLFSLTAVFAALALLAAVVSLFPLVSSRVDYDNLVSVQRAYRNAIWFRATGAIVATVLLGIALILALVAFLVPRERTEPTTAIAAAWDASGAKPVLDVSVEAAHIPRDGRAVVTLLGGGPGKKSRVLATSEAVAGKDGAAKLELKLNGAAKTRYRIEAKVKSAAGKVLRSDSESFSPPPAG